MADLKYVITGTGRCGTLFMANLFTSMGFPCTHEAIFTPKGLEWATEVMEGKRQRVSSRISEGRILVDDADDCVAESSYMAAPFLERTKTETKVVHVVRNPMKVIASLTGEEFMQFTNSTPTHFEQDPNHIEYENFIYEHVPEMTREDIGQLDRACLFYLRWNEMIEKSNRAFFHRIEDGTDKIKEFVGFEGEYYYDNKTCNSFQKKRQWSISELTDGSVKAELKNMADRYGYKIH